MALPDFPRELDRPACPVGRPQLRFALGTLLPLLFAAFVLWRGIPDVVDAYKTDSLGDANYLLAAGKVIRSDTPGALYETDPERQQQNAARGLPVPGGYPYAPITAIAASPLTRLSDRSAFTIWKALIALSTAVIALGVVRSFSTWTWRIAVVAAIACWSPLLLNVPIGQTGAFVAALTCVGFLTYLRWPERGAAVLGLLVFKPQALVAPGLALIGRPARHWLPFLSVAFIVGVLPFLWLGFDSLTGWIHILRAQVNIDLSGGHAYNQGLSAVIDLHGLAGRLLLGALLLVLVLVAVASQRRLGIEATAAAAIFAGILVNPHSLIYDWVVAFVGILLIRRSKALGFLATDTGAGLLAISLFFAGQTTWSHIYKQVVIQPITAWAICAYAGLALVLLRTWLLPSRRASIAEGAGRT